jgi:hypothetical protein
MIRTMMPDLETEVNYIYDELELVVERLEDALDQEQLCARALKSWMLKLDALFFTHDSLPKETQPRAEALLQHIKRVQLRYIENKGMMS